MIGAVLIAAWVAAALAPAAAALAPAVAALAPAAAVDKGVAVRLEAWRFFAGAPPTGWTEPAFDDGAWAGPAPGPFAPRPPLPPTLPPTLPLTSPPTAPPAPAATPYSAVPGAPLLLRSRFAVDGPGRVRVLELSIAYADGFVAYINGREVARRGVVMAGTEVAGAAPHGPEVERVNVAVPSSEIPSLRSTGNVAAVAVYAAPGRSPIFPTAPAAFVVLAAWSGVRIVRGPYLAAPTQAKRTAAVHVIWQTDLPATGAVVIEGEASRRRAARAPATRQDVELTGLSPGRHYRYRVDVAGAAGDRASSGPFAFGTPAAPPAPLRFAVYGDMRYPGHDAHRAIVEALVREAPALVINTGDLTDDGSQESNWQRYFEITAPLGAIAPVVPVLGNHDAGRGGVGSAKTWALFDVPTRVPPGWTSLDLGGAHFVILDTNEMRDPAQRSWLAADLERARLTRPRAVFAFCHEGPWAHGLHGGESRMVRDYAPVLAAGHVDVLFCGHDHIYERGTGVTPSGNLTYVVTGGGGAPLYDPSCRAATGPAPGDVPGPLPPCPSTVAALTKAYHYVMVEVTANAITLCPRRPDGSTVEPCVRLPPHR